MGEVISFANVTPSPRYDSIPWTDARIEEAATSSGTWATIDTITLSPVDADPSDPAARNLTTDQGTALSLWYRIVFIDGSANESQPTDPIQNASPANLYVTRSSLKDTLELEDETYADADIDAAISAACRAIDEYKQTRFYPTYETRYYDSDMCEWSISIDDLNASTAITVSVDVAGSGSYGTTWVNGTDYYLDPVNADLQGRPYDRLTIRRQSGQRFPGWQRSVRIQGSFGWATAPPQVTQSATILAGRYLKRARETPYGILTVVGEAIGAARLGRIDPDVAFLMEDLGASVPQLIA